MFHRYTQDEAERLFAEFDADGNGRIDLQEWSAVLDSGILDGDGGGGGGGGDGDGDGGNGGGGGGGGGAAKETLSKWTAKLESRLMECPFKDLNAALREHLESGETAELLLGPGSVTMVLITSGGTSTMSGTWG